MAEERIHTIPLRDVFARRRRGRAPKAVTVVREYLEKHMKSEKVKLGKSINESIWERSIQKIPRKLRVHAIKAEDGTVYSELVGTDIKVPTKEEKEAKEKKVMDKLQRVKKDREERKKMTIQDEIEEESGKKEDLKDKKSELKEENKEEVKREEKQASKSEEQKGTGKA